MLLRERQPDRSETYISGNKQVRNNSREFSQQTKFQHISISQHCTKSSVVIFFLFSSSSSFFFGGVHAKSTPFPFGLND